MATFWELLTAELLDDCLDLGFRRLTALLRMDGFEHMGDVPNLGRGNAVKDVPVKLHRATLPTSIGQILPNALNGRVPPRGVAGRLAVVIGGSLGQAGL